jgi:hypothetical protein
MPAWCRRDIGRVGREASKMAFPSIVDDTPNRFEQAGASEAPSGFATDPHSKRINLDVAEWYARLARLAELREAQGGQ